MPISTPWLNPPDFLAAARAGATLAEQERQREQQAQEAANALQAQREMAAQRMGMYNREFQAREADKDAARALTERMGLGRLQLGQERLETQDENSDASRALREQLGLARLTGTGGQSGATSKLDPLTQARRDLLVRSISGLQSDLLKTKPMDFVGSDEDWAALQEQKRNQIQQQLGQLNDLLTPQSANGTEKIQAGFIGTPGRGNQMEWPAPSGTINIVQPNVATPQIGSRIRVTSPDGTTGTIPSEQLNEALKSGYKRSE